MQKLYRRVSVALQIALAILIATFTGGRVLQETDGMIPFFHFPVVGSSSSQGLSSDDSARRGSRDSIDGELSCGHDDDDARYTWNSTLSPSMRKLEQAIGKLRVAERSLADVTAADDETLSTATTKLQKAQLRAQKFLGQIQVRMDNDAKVNSDFDGVSNGKRVAKVINRRYGTIFQADELRLLGVQ